MPDSLYGPYPDGGLLPELPAEGLVLWRLQRGDDRWWCTVEDCADQLALRVHTPDDTRTAFTEVLETAAAAVQRADTLYGRYLAQGWEPDEGAYPSLLMTVWFAPPGWEVTAVETQTRMDDVSPESIMSQPPLGRVLSPEVVDVVLGALDEATNGRPQTVYFKAIRHDGVFWRRGLAYRQNGRVRLDIYQAAEAEAIIDAVEVDLRG